MKIILNADIKKLPELNLWIAKVLNKNEVPISIVSKALLSAEEIFVNIASYAYGHDRGKVEILINVTNAAVILTFCDSGSKYDPLLQDIPDLSGNIDKRDIGGLGVYLYKNLADRVIYERSGNRNILKLEFNYNTE